jgi:hypothetical protein
MRRMSFQELISWVVETWLIHSHSRTASKTRAAGSVQVSDFLT